MRSHKLFSALFFLLILTNCNTSKKATVKNEMTSVQLDTISVVTNDHSKRQPYKASNERTNDIIHTKLEVSFDWKLSRMNGRATIQLKPHFYPTSVLYLNARGMEIKKVVVMDINKPIEAKKAEPGADADAVAASMQDDYSITSYTYQNDSLKINLGRRFSSDENYFVIIDYVAKPNELKSAGGSNAITDDKGLYFINPAGENPFKMPQIWTQGETQANSVWFPTIDSPNEKMTQEILMRVDNKYTTLSNGSLISSVKQNDGTRIDHWKLDQPHAPYLAMMAVGEFKKVIDEPWKGKEISYYVDALYEADAKTIFGDTKEMIEFYSNTLGVPYAWPKYSQIVARDYVSGAMENTSATLHGDFMVYQTSREMLDSKRGNSVIAHELFHQWFGDLVTCESWSNLPLNESFATYGEYMWEEYKFGRDAADYHRWLSKQGYLNSTKEVELIRFNYHDKEDMFDAFSYNKGGLILHMLRKLVGDRAFYASLKNYLETNKFKSVEVHNLRLAFEEVTGKDLNRFFNQWFLTKGRPSLKIRKEVNKSLDTLKVTVEQTQDLSKYPLYILPLEVDLYANGGVERKHIVISENKSTFYFKIQGEPQLVNFDAERQLIADIDYPKTQAEYLFQYSSAPLFEDRQEALNGIEEQMQDGVVYALFKQVLEKEKSKPLRHYALQRLEKVSPEKRNEVKSLLIMLYQKEVDNITRAKILGALNRMSVGTVDMIGLNSTALNDKSYAVCAEALTGIAKSDVKMAMEKAILLERESGKELLFVIANLYANNGGDGQVHFFHDALKFINGFDVMGFAGLYTKTARQCKIPENVLTTARDLEMLSNGANKYIKFTMVKGIKDILSSWESKENTVQTKLETAKQEKQSTTELEKELQVVKTTKITLTEIYNRAK
ncbi:M1 family metallopeptidase [Aurantibacillus circumpalustris]|uniref:M1 family metallopeptidase n=1 Tax=Aurantibacillus circumpalustris TaxID=3036359 RepID=UPI00295BFDC5|nr:M1 family metallopeptidase [Aurantibacillus circumpalustris]